MLDDSQSTGRVGSMYLATGLATWLMCLGGCQTDMSSGIEKAETLLKDEPVETAALSDTSPLPSTSMETPRKTNRLQMSFRRIPAGKMEMGTPPDNPFGQLALSESPQHRVRLSTSFWLGEHEVTLGQFRQFVAETGMLTEAEQDGSGVYGLDMVTGKVERRAEWTWKSPGFAQEDNHPVVGVSWKDAEAFCRWLSRKEGDHYRLPTEAEWEYACRAGTTTPFSSGEFLTLRRAGNVGDLTLLSVYSQATGSAPWNDLFAFTAPVGSFEPNAFGLYDMHGNVGEWCADWYGADYYSESPEVDPSGPSQPGEWRVVRGGSWYNNPASCRSASRHDGVPTAPSTTNGFRVVLEQSGQ